MYVQYICLGHAWQVYTWTGCKLKVQGLPAMISGNALAAALLVYGSSCQYCMRAAHVLAGSCVATKREGRFLCKQGTSSLYFLTPLAAPGCISLQAVIKPRHSTYLADGYTKKRPPTEVRHAQEIALITHKQSASMGAG
eukprot:1155346-Pelagomonas_calceolata.AAC.5